MPSLIGQPERLDFVIVRGASFEQVLWGIDGTDATVDYSGYGISGIVTSAQDSEIAIATFDTSIIDNPETEEPRRAYQISLAESATAALDPGVYYYRLFLTPPGRESVCELHGTINVW